MIIFGLCNNSFSNEVECLIIFLISINKNSLFRWLKSKIPFINNSLYIKDGEEISKYLAFIGANKAVLKFEEIRVIRDMRNNVNRLVNCETANLNKTINAALKQIDDINFIIKCNRFSELTENLQEIAHVRLENPDASLIELGKMLNNPIGKSGVNYRLKMISDFAEELRNKGK